MFYKFLVRQRTSEDQWDVRDLECERSVFTGTKEEAIDFSVSRNADNLAIIVKPSGDLAYFITNGEPNPQPW